jgi:hypothetical protein
MGRALVIIRSNGDRERIIGWVRQAPWGTRVEFKAAQRTTPQNSKMWACLTDIAHQKGRFSTEGWKVRFMKACGIEVQLVPDLDDETELIPWGYHSSNLSKGEMSDLIEFMMAWGAENGIVWHDTREPQ